MNTSTKYFRLGILGGMGPLAGVQLQKLIIEATPAKVDQDHIQVVCFTNPKVPDRTASLELDGGKTYVAALHESLGVLEAAAVDAVVIPCNTAHARIHELQKSRPGMNFVNIAEATTEAIALGTLASRPSVLLLATNGTRTQHVYEQTVYGKQISWLYPSVDVQNKVMELVYAVKACGVTTQAERAFIDIVKQSLESLVNYVVLGCTELSLFMHLQPQVSVQFVDPLQVVARKVVAMSKC